MVDAYRSAGDLEGIVEELTIVVEEIEALAAQDLRAEGTRRQGTES